MLSIWGKNRASDLSTDCGKPRIAGCGVLRKINSHSWSHRPHHPRAWFRFLGRKIDCTALYLGMTGPSKCPDLRLFINMSARSFGYRQWVDLGGRALRRDSSIADRLILEIPESSAMLVPELVMHFMCDLRQRGITFALMILRRGQRPSAICATLRLISSWLMGNSPKMWPLTLIIRALRNRFNRHLTTLVCKQLPKLWNADVKVNGCVKCWQIANKGIFGGAPTVNPNWHQGYSEKEAATA